MITPFEVYLILKLDSLNNIFIFLMVFSFAVSLFSFWMASEISSEEEEDLKKCGKYSLYSLIAGFIFIILLVIIPTTKEACTIFLVPKIANSDFAKEAQNIPSDLTKLAEKYIQSKLNDDEDKK